MERVGFGSVVLRPQTGERFPCPHCFKSFVHKSNLRRHKKQCEGQYHLECQYCRQLFYRRDLYQDHLLNRHGIMDAMKGKLANSKRPPGQPPPQ
jgi:uncharacterized Zn-finger protein